MSVMINIFFQVSGVAQSGKNIGVRYSRYASFGIGLSRLELIHSYPSSSSNSSSELEHRCKWFFADLLKQFPEFSDNALKIFKLVSHDSNGDLILLDSARDLYTLVCSNKEKCVAGVAIPLSIEEWPPKSSTEIGYRCRESDTLSVLGLLESNEKMDAHIKEQDAEILRLSDRIEAMEIQSRRFERGDTLENLITNKFKELDVNMKRFLVTKVNDSYKQTDSHYATPLPSTAPLLPIHLEENKSILAMSPDDGQFLMDPNCDIMSLDDASIQSDSSNDSICIVEDLLGVPILTKDSFIRNHDAGLRELLAIGYQDVDGRLTRLLETKGGNVEEALNVLRLWTM